MLKNKTEEVSLPTAAAQVRVTPEELAVALNVLETEKQEAARHRESTVPIGEVVSEMNLEVTPDEVWAQVQKQRRQAEADAEAQVQVQRTATVTKTATARRRIRSWRDIKAWVWVLFWVSGGGGLLTLIPHLIHPAPPVGISVAGDHVSGTYTVQGTGPQRDATVSGDNDTITLRGDVRNLKVEGEDNTVTVIGSVEGVKIDDSGNTVHWTKEVPGKVTQPVVNGDGNKFGMIQP